MAGIDLVRGHQLVSGAEAGVEYHDAIGDELAPVLGACGGSSADMAQGAGGDPAKLPAAFDALRSSRLTSG